MMLPRKLQTGPIAERARRSAREIVIAVVLTFAAVVFIVAAVHGNGSETASISAPQDSVEKHSN